MTNYKTIVFLIFLIGDEKFLKETGFSNYDIDHSSLEFKKISIEKHEDYFDHIKNQEKSIVERVFF